MTAEGLLSLRIVAVLEFLHGRELVTPLLALLREFALERLVFPHELLLERRGLIRGGRAVVGIEDVVPRLEALVIKEEVVGLLVVDLVHPVLQGEHLTLLIVYGGGVKGDDPSLAGVLFGDVIVPNPLVVPSQLGHVSGLDVIPRPLKVLGALIGVPIVHLQLGHPLGEHDGRLSVVLEARQYEVCHVEVQVVHEPHLRFGARHSIGVLNHIHDLVLGFVGQPGPVLLDVHVGHGVSLAEVGLVGEFFARGPVGGELIVELHQILLGEGPLRGVDQVLPVFLNVTAREGVKAPIVVERPGLHNCLRIDPNTFSVLVLDKYFLQIFLCEQHLVVLAQNLLHFLQIHVLFQLLALLLCHSVHDVIHRFC
mmetsp:Transcript_46588/g.98868  ORF Transcript_46588/g.98868 Transcript_46588/m.98868 type:complete len:367 (-) Transcript_46588:1011-2111(-)